MGYFNSEFQNNFKADFGFASPKRTKKKCISPTFADHHLHRIAYMKDYHVGSKGDIEENGLEGWVSKMICTSCNREFGKVFFADKKQIHEQINP